jgi:hypothetical protein
MATDVQALLEAANQPATRAQIDHFYVEAALEGLGLPLPKSVDRLRHALDQLEELRRGLDAGRQMPTPAELGRQLLAKSLAGDAADPTKLVKEARVAADAELAVSSVSKAIEAAEGTLPTEYEVQTVQRELLATITAAIEEVEAEARKLPPNTPQTERQAVRADDQRRRAYLELERLSARHVELRQLHLALVRDQVEPPEALVIFADTQNPPSVAPSARQAAVAAGPSDALARLLWLSSKEGRSWVPDGRQIMNAYQEFVQSLPINKSKQPAAPLSATTTTVKV